jgi:hypothetical protein
MERCSTGINPEISGARNYRTEMPIARPQVRKPQGLRPGRTRTPPQIRRSCLKVYARPLRSAIQRSTNSLVRAWLAQTPSKPLTLDDNRAQPRRAMKRPCNLLAAPLTCGMRQGAMRDEPPDTTASIGGGRVAHVFDAYRTPCIDTPAEIRATSERNLWSRIGARLLRALSAAQLYDRSIQEEDTRRPRCAIWYSAEVALGIAVGQEFRWPRSN